MVAPKCCGEKMKLKLDAEFIKPSRLLFQASDPTIEIWQCGKCKEIEVVIR